MANLDAQVAKLISHLKSSNAEWANMVNRDHVLAALDLIDAGDLAYEAGILQEEGELDADLEDIQESIFDFYSTIRNPSEFSAEDLQLVWTEDLGLEKADFVDHVVSEGVSQRAASRFLELSDAE
jgi:hypothetical protein